MSDGCRDCRRCTETGATGLIFILPRMIWTILTCWNIGLFQRKCPKCGHKMGMHKMVDGRLQD